LVASLNKRWKRKLAEYTDVPDRYPALLTYLRKLGSNAFLTGTGAPTFHPGYQRGHSLAGDPMQVDISTARVRTGGTGAQIAPTQRKQWKKEGRCTGCGSKDHWSRDCPQSPEPRSTPSQPRSTPSGSTPRINAIDIGRNTIRTYALRTGPSAHNNDDDDDDDDDSEFDENYYNPDVLS